MPHQRFINRSTLHFEANKMSFYRTSSRSSGSSVFFYSYTTLSQFWLFLFLFVLHLQALAIQIFIVSHHPFVRTPLHPCVCSESRVLNNQPSLFAKTKKTNTNWTLLTFSNSAMTCYTRKNQKLLAYANHIKGHSHWQRFAAKEQVAFVVGEVTRDQNLQQI